MRLPAVTTYSTGKIAALAIGFAMLFVLVPLTKSFMPFPFPWFLTKSLEVILFLGLAACTVIIVSRAALETGPNGN